MGILDHMSGADEEAMVWDNSCRYSEDLVAGTIRGWEHLRCHKRSPRWRPLIVGNGEEG
jgi:hypothetical protein